MKRQATKEAKEAALLDSRAQAAEARVAARLLRATNLAVEKAHLQSEKAAKNLAQAAAEKLKKAELKTPRTNSIKQDCVARKAAKQAVLARNMAIRKDAHPPLGSSSTLMLEHHDGPVEWMKRKRVVGSVSGMACGTLGVNQEANHQNVGKIMRERNKDLVIEEMRLELVRGGGTQVENSPAHMESESVTSELEDSSLTT
ncbi:hypothetical protein PGTUg99_020717 [Puccinia graminis f. sp. tritici]|uniref:Uncharacterized protein n=1 Tax=Puccinia graminis f. sp. tritici TaxID=56615 RepID=A0A5B0SKS7_PUCGR|nr:hypothetical protein PGTUg99_020717 [Puccinia graminis f. sp. tritici]